MATKENEMITVQEAAKQLRVGESTLRRAIKVGTLKARRIGAKSWVMTRADLENWKANRRIGRPRKTRA
jgi:excisionase family DNA binding protein